MAALAFAVVAIVFAFRPTPLLGVDGASLSRSVNGDLELSTDPCEPSAQRREGEWRCFIWGEGRSGGGTYAVAVDWAGCWKVTLRPPIRSKSGAPEPPRTSGCVTLLSHVGVW